MVYLNRRKQEITLKFKDMEIEKTFVFKEEDLMKYGVLSPNGAEFMAIISGFDLNLAFNMRLINSLGDAENCANAIGFNDHGHRCEDAKANG